MENWIRRLASLKITVTLLVLAVVVLAAGTIVEALRGAEAARAVYYGPWFFALVALLGVNVACSLWERWPWGRYRIGFVLTHGSLLVILLGSVMSCQLKEEGNLALWEGEASDIFVEARPGAEMIRHRLPFEVRLEAFEIDYYPGTRRPAMFRSRVRVEDPVTDEELEAIIEMNRELAYRGFRLFQSSYRQSGGREMSVLAVSRDPGQPVVFAGYILLVLGMVTVLITRIVQRRQLAAGGLPTAPPPSSGPAPKGLKIVGLWLVAALFVATAPAPAADDAPLPDAETVAALRRLPVQHDGRVMPLDTLAREAVWNVTGARRWRDIDPVALVLGWSFDPERWVDEPLVRVDGRELEQELGLEPGLRHAAWRQLVSNPRAQSLMQEASSAAEAGEGLPPLLEQAQELQEGLVWMHRFLNRDAYRVVPASDPQAAWSVPASLESPGDLVALGRKLGRQAPSGYPGSGAMEREVLYNRLQPFRLACWVLALATLASVAAWLRPGRRLGLVAAALLMAGFGVMTWGLALRWQIAGRIPAANMYESMLFLGWGVGLFAVVAALALRQRLVILNAAFLATVAMLLVEVLPLDPFIHPMPPVLRGTAWLAIHVPITMVSYSIFALGVLVAHVQIGAGIVAPGTRELAARLGDLLYWYIHVGSILLAGGIFTGSIWAASSWGRYWGWDPKEVWSLVALLAYMAILHARFDRLIGPFGTAAWSIVAFWTILMTYVGVNFVLAAGLHSYGFGGGAVTRWMAWLALGEILFLLAGVTAQRRQAEAGVEE